MTEWIKKVLLPYDKVGWAFQPNATKERTGGQRERAESGVRDARNSFSASRARKAGIIIR